jgi:hypothetical protein
LLNLPTIMLLFPATLPMLQSADKTYQRNIIQQAMIRWHWFESWRWQVSNSKPVWKYYNAESTTVTDAVSVLHYVHWIKGHIFK